jgi:2-oxo-3-hexenedioate decarboxylase
VTDAAVVTRVADTIERLGRDAALAEPPSAGGTSFDLAEGYAIAREVLRRRQDAGWRRLGRKIAFTNGDMMRLYGISAPLFGYMYDRTLIHADAGEASIPVAGLVQPKIEPEIAFKLRGAPPASGDPAALLASIEWLAQGFELVQCHFPGWEFAAPDAVADGGFHGRYVVGEPVAVTAGDAERLASELATFRIELVRNGEPAAEGGGANVLGSPLNALAHLVDVLSALPGHPPLAAGEIITSGTLTAALPIEPGQVWTTRIAGLVLPPVTLRLTA